MTVARLWSCRAAATISDAEAEPALISTTIGKPAHQVAALCPERPVAADLAAADADDDAAVEKLVGDRQRLVEQAARIVAQVDDQPLQLCRLFCAHVFDGVLDALGHLLVEADDAQVADVVPPASAAARW